MAKKPNPRELLDEVLVLIKKDIEEIERLSQAGKLEADVSGCLTRYSDALLKIIKDKDNQDDAEKQRLANMSKEELTSIAKKYIGEK